MIDRPYVRPTPDQRDVIEAVLETGSIAKAAALLGITPTAAYGRLESARKRTGMTNEQMIAAGTRDGWISLGKIPA